MMQKIDIDDMDILYAVKCDPDVYEIFGEDHVSLGFETQDYLQRYRIPEYTKEYHQKEFTKYWGIQ